MVIIAASSVLLVAVLVLGSLFAVGTKRPAAVPSTRMSAPSTPSASPTPVPTTVPPGSPAPPVPLPSPAPISPTLTVRIGSLESVQGVAKGPGQVAGPAIRFAVSVTNTGSSAIDLTGAVVTVYYSSTKIPASQLDQPGGANLPSSVAPSTTATGTYIFTVPVAQRADVQIEFDYAIGFTPVVFRGAAPR